MKKLLYLIMLLALGLSACEKDQDEAKPEDSLVWIDGKSYEETVLKAYIVRSTGIAEENLIFDKENLLYYHKDYDMQIYVRDYLPYLN